MPVIILLMLSAIVASSAKASAYYDLSPEEQLKSIVQTLNAAITSMQDSLEEEAQEREFQEMLVEAEDIVNLHQPATPAFSPWG